MRLILLLFLNFTLESKEIKNKLVLDYGNFLSIEQQKNLHSTLENFYKKNNIYISIITLEKENFYNLNRSVYQGIKKITKRGFRNIILILRSLESYNFYIFGFENSFQVKRILEKAIKNEEKDQNFFEEFKSLIEILEKEKEFLNKYVLKNNFMYYFLKYKYYILLLSCLIFVLIVNIHRKRKKYLERLGIK